MNVNEQPSSDRNDDLRLMTVVEAADYLAMSRGSIYNLMRSGPSLRCTSAAPAVSLSPSSTASSARRWRGCSRGCIQSHGRRVAHVL